MSSGVDMIDVSDHYEILDNRYAISEAKQAIKTYQQLGEDDKKNLHFHDANYRKIRGLERFHNRSDLIPLKDYISIENLCKICSLPEEIVTVNYQGNVVLCARQWIDSPTYGNVTNEHIKTIWKKPEFAQVRKALRKGIFELELCKNCGFGYPPEPAEILELKASQSTICGEGSQ